MAKRKGQSTSEELDKYITDKFNLEIYEFVNKEQSLFMCEPLAFLQLLHSTYEWILQNTDKPLAIAERLKNPFPCRWYFLEKLEGLLQRKVDGYDLSGTEKFLIDQDNKERKQLKEALEVVRDKRSDEERHLQRVAREAKHKGQEYGEDLESWLTNNFNLAIYEDLTEGDNAGVFEPLEFFKLLFAQYKFVKANKGKPLTVVESLSKLNLTDEQK